MNARWLISVLFALLLPLCLNTDAAEKSSASAAPKQRKNWKDRWVLLMYGNRDLERDRDAWPEMQRRIRRAAKAGYNGIVYADRDEYWYKGKAAELWRKRLGELRKLTTSLNMKFIVHCVPAKGGGTPEMGSSFPVKDAPLIVKNGVLVPVRTASIENGSFEQFQGNVPAHFELPEAGKHAFIHQTNPAHDGKTSVRVQNFHEVRGRLAMPVQTVKVKPFQHYRVSFWLKISKDFKGNLKIMARVPGEGDRDRDIVCQERQVGRRTPRGKWFRVVSTFNSWNNNQVQLLVGPINWGRKGRGMYWLDLVEIEHVPFLNVNRRAELPNVLKGEDGTVYVEGNDYARIVDPKFGRARPTRPGKFGVWHEHPRIKILPGSAIKEGQKLLYTGYHVALEGKWFGKTPSLASDMVFDMYAEQARILREVAHPDGYLIWFDEMRTGGWEPNELKYKTCGELINAALKRTYDIVMREGGGKPIYTWHDMLSPGHNARANYHLLRNTAEGAGKDLPKGLGIWVWGSGRNKLDDLPFFAKQGLRQMICTYYDTSNIRKQYLDWMRTLDETGVEVGGVVYSSWGKGKSKPGGGFADLESSPKSGGARAESHAVNRRRVHISRPEAAQGTGEGRDEESPQLSERRC